MSRKSDLLREAERRYFWQCLVERLEDVELRYRFWQIRRNARRLEKLGIL